MAVSDITDSPRPIRLMRNASAYHRFLRHRAGVPRKLADAAVRGLKRMVNPSEGSRRKQMATRAGPGGEPDARLAEDGYVLFDRSTFPELQQALDRHRGDIEAVIHRAEERSLNLSANKTMLTTVIANNGFFECPDLFAFAVSHPVIDLATRYFGGVPLLTACSLWWSPPNDTVQQSQLFHCDGEDRRQLKFFFNVSEVTEEHGPFTLLPGGLSDRIRERRNIVAGKVADEVLEAEGALDKCLVLTGAPGEGACVDTCRCLHYGSRGNSKTRVVLMLRFNDYLAPNVDMPDWHLGAGEIIDGLDDLQKLVLGIEAG